MGHVKDTQINAEEAVQRLADAKQELSELWKMLKDRHPGLFERIAEIEGELPALQNNVKNAVRSLGKGAHDFGGHVVLVKSAPVTKKVNLEDLLERAEERGEIDDLLDAEVLVYSVQMHMIERLEGPMKAVYAGYIEESEGTASVMLPAQLK